MGYYYYYYYCYYYYLSIGGLARLQTPEQQDNPSTDVIVKFYSLPDETFVRLSQSDLSMNLHITLEEVYRGFKRKQTHLDGHEFNIIGNINDFENKIIDISS